MIAWGFLILMGAVVGLSFIQEARDTAQARQQAEVAETAAASTTIVEIASSNTKQNWMDAVAAQFNAENHTLPSGDRIEVRVSHVLSGGSQQAILSGSLQPTVWSPGEYSWVESANQTWRDRTGRPLVPDACPQTVNAPSGIAMWRPMAEALGWPDTPVGWADLLALADSETGWAELGHPEWGEFKFGHVHPDYSNVGLLMMTSLAYYAAGKTDGLTPDDVYSGAVEDAFRQLELNTWHYGLQSRDLLSLMTQRGPAYLHAVTTSEAETLRTNAEQTGQLRFPLAFIFPADGTFWSQHPYCILNGEWVSADQREAAGIFRDYLLAPEQQAMAVDSYLRPVDEQAELHAPIALEQGTDPRVTMDSVPQLESPSADAANAVRDVFHETKRPATIVLVIDTSGSMGGDKMTNAAESARNFISRMSDRDEVYVLGFGTTPYWVGEGGPVAAVGETMAESVGGVFADGNTALHDAICMAADRVEELRTQSEADTPHLFGIVLLSDGADRGSVRSENFMFTTCLPDGESVEGVRVYTIAYGADANLDLMTRIANRTNGRAFEGNPENIERIYTAISAEQ